MTGSAEHPDEIRGILLPTGAANLLLPNAAVAEIIGYQNPTPYRSAPGWLLGSVTWRGFSIPLVSLAMANTEPVEVAHGQRARIVICYTPSGNRALPYVAMLSLSPPRLARWTPQVLEPTETPPENPLVLYGLYYGEQPAWIPDMDAVERTTLEAMEA